MAGWGSTVRNIMVREPVIVWSCIIGGIGAWFARNPCSISHAFAHRWIRHSVPVVLRVETMKLSASNSRGLLTATTTVSNSANPSASPQTGFRFLACLHATPRALTFSMPAHTAAPGKLQPSCCYLVAGMRSYIYHTSSLQSMSS